MDELATELWDRIFKVDVVDTGTIHAPKTDWPGPVVNVATKYGEMIDMHLGKLR